MPDRALIEQIRHLREDEHVTFAAIAKQLGISQAWAWQLYQYSKRPQRTYRPTRGPHRYQ
jgi:hypothetical protein